MGKCITIIAQTGQGKTTMIRKITDKKRCCVFDVQGEYTELPFDLSQPRSRFFGKHGDFIEACKDMHAGTFCVFEEATGFLSGATALEMRNFLISKRHPVEKGGRNIIFVFHTIQSVPPFILDMSEYFILFKTGDNPINVKKKAPKLYQAFLKLQRMPKYSKIIIQNV